MSATTVSDPVGRDRETGRIPLGAVRDTLGDRRSAT